jgi:hypothetical protein
MGGPPYKGGRRRAPHLYGLAEPGLTVRETPSNTPHFPDCQENRKGETPQSADCEPNADGKPI